MFLLSFLALLAVAIGIRFIGNRLVPLAMPPGRLRPVGVGLAGGFLGSFLFQHYHLGDWAILADANLIGAAIGAALFILIWGLAPFIKVLLRRV